MKAQIGFEGWIANQQIDEMEYRIFEDFDQNLWYFYFTTNTKWNISRQFQGIITMPRGGTGALQFYSGYEDLDITLDYVMEHDNTGKKPASR